MCEFCVFWIWNLCIFSKLKSLNEIVSQNLILTVRPNWFICPESIIHHPPLGFRSPKWNCKATETEGGMGEVGGGRLAMPGTSSGGGTPAERRQQILETTLQAVKRCQVSISANRSLIFKKHFLGEVWWQAGVGHWGKWWGAGLADQVKLEASWDLNSCCCRLELVLGHGMREPGAPSLGLAVMRFLLKRKTYKILSQSEMSKIWSARKTLDQGTVGGFGEWWDPLFNVQCPILYSWNSWVKFTSFYSLTFMCRRALFWTSMNTRGTSFYQVWPQTKEGAGPG